MKSWLLGPILAASLLGSMSAAQGAAVPAGPALVPAGEFWQGRVYRTLIEELDMMARVRLDDVPAHIVYLDAFHFDKYEVMNSDYLRFAEATGHRKPHHWVGGRVPEGAEKIPVYNVSWDEANAYCEWAGKRLPTESEWEKAARGGTDRFRFSWGDNLSGTGPPAGRGAAPPVASQVATPASTPSPADPVPAQRGRGNSAAPKMAAYGGTDGPGNVGSFPPNQYGIYDTVGNIAEWVQDWYLQNYYSVSPDRNPKGPASGVYRVIRGESWATGDERNLAVNFRNFSWPSQRAVTIGIRCAKSVTPDSK
jgi:iron(II)-dependent oxidoreductase